MTRVSKASVSRLRSPLVEAHLQVHLPFGSPQLIFGEGALVLIGHLRSHARPGVFWMFLRLKTENIRRIVERNKEQSIVKSVLTILASEYKQRVTCTMLRRSNKSAVWKISSSGTPYFLIAAWNLLKIDLWIALVFWYSAVGRLTSVRFPLVGSLCLSLGFFWRILERFCWSICTRLPRLSTRPRKECWALVRPKFRRSIPKLPLLVPCCVPFKIKKKWEQWSYT